MVEQALRPAHMSEIASLRLPKLASDGRKLSSDPSRDFSDDISLNDGIPRYFREAANHRILEDEEVRTFCKLMKQGKDARIELLKYPEKVKELQNEIALGIDAEHQLISHNFKLVVSVAKKYVGKGVPFFDLIQEGNIGLIRGIRKFDYQRGNTLATYVTWWIRQAVSRCVLEDSRTIRVPVSIGERINQMTSLQYEHQKKFGFLLDDEALMQLMNLKPKRFKIIKETYVRQHCFSLDEVIEGGEKGEDGDMTLGDVVPDPLLTEDIVEMSSTAAVVRNVIERLPLLERQIIQLAFGIDDLGVKNEEVCDPLTNEEIAKKLHTSEHHVGYMKSLAFSKLRRMIPRES